MRLIMQKIRTKLKKIIKKSQVALGALGTYCQTFLLKVFRGKGARKSHIVLPLCVALLVIGGSLYAYGDRVSMVIWNNFHIMPEVVTFFNPDDAELAISIGYYSFNTFGRNDYDLDKAKYYLYRALELDPMASTAWHQLARIDFLEGNLGAALLKENKQIELHGDDFMPAYYVRGLVYAYGGRLDEAEQDFLKYLEWKKESWAANNDLAWIYFRKGEYGSMLIYANQGLLYDSSNPWLLMMRGVALMNLGDIPEARTALLQARESMSHITERDWISAYPGNDPSIAERGLSEMQATIEANLLLVD